MKGRDTIDLAIEGSVQETDEATFSKPKAAAEGYLVPKVLAGTNASVSLSAD